MTALILAVFTVLILLATTASAEESSPGWCASAALVKSFSERRGDTLYDEARVPAFTLPDVLAGADADSWRTQRRPELLELFRKHVYGRAALERPAGLSFHVFEQAEDALTGTAVRKQVRVRFTGEEDGPGMDLLLYLPKASPKPVPVFVLLNFGGNHTVCADPAIRLTGSWTRSKDTDHRATEAQRGAASSRFPLGLILQRGYGLATAYYGDLDPDFDDGFKNGVQGAFDPVTEGKRPGDAWGAIGAWAWGLSRALDYFETDPGVDAKHVAVLGHSRLGKTSLWAGAQDERFALVISNDSGCGGAALHRRQYGETVARINKSFPHWFCRNFHAYGERVNDLPVDQHELLALIAPRPLYVASADQDLWADPRGEFLSLKGADPVYRLLGTEGLPTAHMPPLDTPVMGTLGYHVRSGKHDLTPYDWEQYLTFADKHFGAR